VRVSFGYAKLSTNFMVHYCVSQRVKTSLEQASALSNIYSLETKSRTHIGPSTSPKTRVSSVGEAIVGQNCDGKSRQLRLVATLTRPSACVPGHNTPSPEPISVVASMEGPTTSLFFVFNSIFPALASFPHNNMHPLIRKISVVLLSSYTRSISIQYRSRYSNQQIIHMCIYRDIVYGVIATTNLHH
jgi:hypothetical protein